MNCIIFTGGISPHYKTAQPYVNKSDFCIAADSGLLTAEKYGFFPNLIVGDFDSLAEKDKNYAERLAGYPKNIVRRWKTDKDFTDTEIALFAAQDEAAKRGEQLFITLIGGSGGRIDHFFALYALFSRSLHPHMWLCEKQVVYCIDSFENVQKSITLSNLQQHDAVSVFAIQPPYTELDKNPKKLRVVSSGLYWSLHALEWTSGFCSISNRISIEHEQKKLPVTITAECGTFLVIVPL